MKTIGIISDTHSCRDDRYAAHFSNCDEIWHAGDIGDDELFNFFENMGPKFRAVCGNIDYGMVRRKNPELLIFEIEKIRVMMTHIGGYPGKYARGLETLIKEYKPNLLICGHSHILKVMNDKFNDLLYINPGAAGYHGFQKVRTLIKLVIDNGSFKGLDVIELGNKIL